MKTKLALFTIAAAASVLVGCASTGSTTGATAKAKPYPLETCIVTDNELGSMGTPLTKVYDGQTVKFCCKPCVREFEENPAKFLPKLKQS